LHMTSDQPTPDRILQLATGYGATGVLGAATGLGCSRAKAGFEDVTFHSTPSPATVIPAR